MGALVADVSLQAAVNYSAVVRPRIVRILDLYPRQTTITAVLDLLGGIDACHFLKWRHPAKPKRFVSLIECLHKNRIDDVDDLTAWLNEQSTRTALLSIEGIGNKSFDYLKLLCGLDVFPIDRHMRRLLSVAGIDAECLTYHKAQHLFDEACRRLALNPGATERSLWELSRSC